MLIKQKKLANRKGAHGVNAVEISETSRTAQLEIQRAKQEARAIKQEAQSILEGSQKKLQEAEEKAREIINTTNIEAKKIKEKVYQETLQAAKKEGEVIKTRASELLKQLFEVKRAALTQAHNEIIKVALDLAEKVIRYKASIDPDILKTQVIEAIKKATSEAERVKVYVNPVDLKTLEVNIPNMEKLFPSGVDIVPLANDSVDPGSCIVETKSGQLDATFSAQLTALTELASHLEVKEPMVQVGDDVESIKASVTEEKEELLGDEPLINISEEEGTFSFEPSLVKEEYQERLPKESSQQEQAFDLVQEEKVVENIEEGLFEEPQAIYQKKKLVIDSNFIERTKEETEELDEERKEAKTPELKNVLKPKKVSSSEVSKIAQEIEQSKEWKDLIQEEDE